MDFIYRLPLIQFDIHDPAAIQKNYPQILEAVRLSSPSLYNTIYQKPYASLTENQKLKLHKYLLRGKYRAVPFGTWSGVGIGQSGYENHMHQVEAKALSDCSRTFETFTDKISDPQYLLKGAFRLIPWIYQLKEEYVYWEFNMKERLWETSQIKRNKVLDTVFSYRNSEPEITFTLFSSWFDIIGDRDLILEAWKNLVHSGFLISCGFPDMNRFSSSREERFTVADSQVTAPVQPSPTSLQQLETLNKEIGDLVRPVKTSYQRAFHRVFVDRFDDKFVPLHLVFHPRLGIKSKLDQELQKQENTQDNSTTDYISLLHQVLMEEKVKSVDLSHFFKKSPIQATSEITVMFRNTAQGNLYLDVLGYGKSLGLIGRFTHFKAFADYGRSLIQKYYQHPEILYADVKLYEAPKLQQVARHKRLAEHDITLFADGTDSAIPIETLWVGVKDGRIVIKEENGKEVRPLTLHSLNPHLISHPVSRFFWECAQQYQGQWDHPFHLHKKGLTYCPRITWGSTILYPETLMIRYGEVKNAEDLLTKLRAYGFACHFVYGEHDRELLIDTHQEISLRLFFMDLQKKKSISIRECPWYIPPTTNASSLGASYHPQFIVSLDPTQPKEIKGVPFTNKVWREDPDWIYFKLYYHGKDPAAILLNILHTHQVIFGGCQWYYLYYIDHAEHIRIRIKLKNSLDKTSAIAELALSFQQLPAVLDVVFCPYFPEDEKYGAASSNLSEELFCLESEFFTENGSSVPLLQSPFLKRCGFALSFTLLMVEYSGKKDLFLKYYKTRIEEAKLEGSMKRDFKKYFDQYWKGLQAAEVGKTLFVGQYKELMNRCRLEVTEEQFAVQVIKHLHVLYNRLFLDHAVQAEPLIWYSVRRAIVSEGYVKG